MNRTKYIFGVGFLWLCIVYWTACQSDAPADTLFVEKKNSGIDFRNDLQPTDSLNIITYLYYYNGGGVATGDINNDGRPDLFFTANQGPNRLYLNQGDWTFKDISQEAGISGQGQWSTGVSMADINGDGLLDIFVSNVCGYRGLSGGNELWINQGNAQFVNKTADYGLSFCGFGTQMYWLDYDRDGDLDAYQLNHSVHAAENYGKGSLREIADERAGDRLWRQDRTPQGEPFFVDVSAEAGIYQSKIGYGLSASLADFNDDGWPDIYVANDFHENDYLYLNQQDGTFRESLAQSMGHISNFSMGTDAADIDNDGHIDLFSLDMKPGQEAILKSTTGPDPYNIFRFKLKYGYHPQFARNHLQWNQGNGRFSEIAELSGLAATDWSWSALFADYDLDGLQDVYITNGIKHRPNDLDYLKFTSSQELQAGLSDTDLAARMPSGAAKNVVYHNQGNLLFEEIAEDWGLEHNGYSNGAAYADLDGDGDLDVVVNHLDETAGLYENQSTTRSDNHWLIMDFSAKLNVLGTRVIAYSGTDVWLRELFPQRGFQSSSQPILHFGVGQHTQIDSLRIRWPDGQWEQYQKLAVNQALTVEKGKGIPAQNPAPLAAPPLWEQVPVPGLQYRHQENEYTDFDIESLLPHSLSRLGPAVALSQDGYLYLGGAHTYPGQLFRMQPGGSATEINIEDFRYDQAHEDVAALFFDADGDGDEDLYVVSGGGGTYADATIYADRLYLREGDSWAKDMNFAGPQRNGSCVVAADFDGDGDNDLFVGTRSIPGAYGATPQSEVLINDGQGSFSPDPDWAPHAKLGMVTDALWLTKEQQLVVVGEWMPLVFLQKEQTDWQQDTLPQSRGWWNTVHAADLDEDQQTELMLGNLGWNTAFRQAQQTAPKLWVADFDQNGQLDPILTYQQQQEDYSFFWKDQLVRQIPGIRRRNVAYADFARQPLHQILGAEKLAQAQMLTIDRTASAWLQKDAAGSWQFHDLPIAAQTAPIFAFLDLDLDQDGHTDLLAGGNWHDQQPAIGRLDASTGYALRRIADGQFEMLPSTYSGLLMDGELRAIRRLPDGRILALRNNDTPLVYQLKN